MLSESRDMVYKVRAGKVAAMEGEVSIVGVGEAPWPWIRDDSLRRIRSRPILGFRVPS
jgi:hypothetical protein